MHLDPNDLLLFAHVVEEGSFSRAAERMKMPKSTLSRRLTVLESELGERLLLRTTRKLTVTDFGNSVLHHAQQVTSEVEAAQALAQHRQAAPSGRLGVHAERLCQRHIRANAGGIRRQVPGDFAGA